MKYIFLFLMFVQSTYAIDVLVEKESGEQDLFLDIMKYTGSDTVIFKGKFPRELIGKVGYLAIHPVTGRLVEDKDKKLDFNSKEAAKEARKNRIKNFDPANLNPAQEKKILRVMIREYIKTTEFDPADL